MSSDALGQVEEWLSRQPLGPDRRLPAERQLAAELGLPRAKLRQALATLERDGRLTRHVGRGTFLTDAGSSPRIVQRRPAGLPGWAQTIGAIASPAHLVQVRLSLEPATARRAAASSTRADLDAIAACAADVRAAQNWERFDAADIRFHLRLAESAGNPLLAALLEAVLEVARGMNWGRLRTRAPAPTKSLPALAEHDALLHALAERDADGAAEAMRRHLLIEWASLGHPEA